MFLHSKTSLYRNALKGEAPFCHLLPFDLLGTIDVGTPWTLRCSLKTNSPFWRSKNRTDFPLANPWDILIPFHCFWHQHTKPLINKTKPAIKTARGPYNSGTASSKRTKICLHSRLHVAQRWTWRNPQPLYFSSSTRPLLSLKVTLRWLGWSPTGF